MVHIEEHFNKKSTPSPVTPDVSTDRMLAKDMERREKEVRKLREQREFEMLRAQYGMDNQGNFREQSVTNMQRAVYAGEMTVADFFERQIELRVAENTGIDDGSSCTRGKAIYRRDKRKITKKKQKKKERKRKTRRHRRSV